MLFIPNGRISNPKIWFFKIICFRILPGIEYVTVPLSLNNLVNTSIVCLKIEQNGDKFTGSGSWFIDDLLIIRSRLQNEYFSETFQAMQPANWYRLAGGQLKVIFLFWKLGLLVSFLDMWRTNEYDLRIEFRYSNRIRCYNHWFFSSGNDWLSSWCSVSSFKKYFHRLDEVNFVFYSIFWYSFLEIFHRWNATGVLDLNKTCTDEDVITFNGENYRQLCSPMIELGKIDSVRFTISTGKLNWRKSIRRVHFLFEEPCMKRNKYIPTPSAVIFLAIFYNGSTVGYSRTIRRILLSEIKVKFHHINIFFYWNWFSKRIKRSIFDSMNYIMMHHHMVVFVYHNIINHRVKMLMFGV
jgi:hypothetical protein